MRIIQAVGWYLPDSLGGTEIYVANLSRRLRQLGHDAIVAAPQPGLGAERDYVQDEVPVYRYPIPAAVHSRAEARGWIIAAGAERFHQWLMTQRPDVVHVHTFVTGLGLLELEAARAAGARVIVTSHAASLGFVCERGTLLRHGHSLCDGMTDPYRCSVCALQQRGIPAAVGWALAQTPAAVARTMSRLPGSASTVLAMPALIGRNQDAQRRLFELADAVVVLSEFAATVLRANGAPPDKVIVNRLGVSGAPDRRVRKCDAASTPTRTPVTVGFVGRVEAIKGLDDVIRAVLALPESVPLRLRVVAIAGSDRERATLDKWRIAAAHDRRISFEPARAYGEIPSLLRSIDVLCCPSRAVEGGPTIALEAFAAGTPVIGSAVPALTEIIEDGVTGLLHAPGDWRQLSSLLQHVATDPAGTIDRWRRALPMPRTTDEVAADYLELYRG
jgi:glycosyltransferase involved in cell wall biosynthesis